LPHQHRGDERLSGITPPAPNPRLCCGQPFYRVENAAIRAQSESEGKSGVNRFAIFFRGARQVGGRFVEYQLPPTILETRKRRAGPVIRQAFGPKFPPVVRRDPIQGADGKPSLADMSKLEEVSTGRSLRLVLRPLIDAFSGQSQLTDPDWTVRQAAAVKIGNVGDPGVGSQNWAAGRSDPGFSERQG
jgi:hypothetical protein